MIDDTASKLEAAGAAATQRPRRPTALVAPCAIPRTAWIEVELVGEDGKGIADQPYRLVLPDRTVVNGKTDANGLVSVRDFEAGAGVCRVSYLQLDAKVWHLIKK